LDDEIKDCEDEVPIHGETMPSMEPTIKIDFDRDIPTFTSVDYWQAQTFASRLHKEFTSSLKTGNIAGMRSRYYALVDYYEQTMNLMRHSLRDKNSALIVSSLRSLIVLNAPLQEMHKTAPNTIPLPLTLDVTLRKSLISDLIVKAFQDSEKSLELSKIAEYVNQHYFTQEITGKVIEKQLGELIEKGHLVKTDDGFARTKRTYIHSNLDDTSLQAFLGLELYQEFERGGFPGVSNIVNRRKLFYKFFDKLTSLGDLIADLFIASLIELLQSEVGTSKFSAWHQFDLIGSSIPRPYQRDAFTIFRGYGYQGQLIEAPTGSGKTLIGMMAIQDWMTSMSSGESILILVPTVNYEQQWIRELCYKPIGLHLSPDDVYAGTPIGYKDERKSGSSPPILVMTYTSLAQLGSPRGKGGFDRISVEKFLQGSNIRYVIFDEVHKVVDNIDSVSAGITKLLLEWMQDGSLEGLIGFSGTATAFRQRFHDLGLQLVYNMPAADLIAYGFVAPFAEFGLPFTQSVRERNVLSLLDVYKSSIKEFIDALGSTNLRTTFSQIPIDKRITIGRDILGIYAGRKDQDIALAQRYREWENGEELNLSEMQLVSIIQIADNLSDTALIDKMVTSLAFDERRERKSKFASTLAVLFKLRQKMAGLVFSPDIAKRLETQGFGTKIDTKSLQKIIQSETTKMEIRAGIKDLLSTTIIGLYTSLNSLYYRMGEGRVESVNSIIKAERAVRKINAVIVFGQGKRIRWEEGPVSPGYAGVAGIFTQMLGQRDLYPMAVLSSELYLPWTEKNQAPQRIASFIKDEIMAKELGDNLFGLLTQGLGLSHDMINEFKKKFDSTLRKYVKNLTLIGAARPKEFVREVLTPLRKTLRKYKEDEAIPKLKSRLSVKNRHTQKWMNDFYDYGIISTRFMKAKIAELFQASGEKRKFFVVKMPQGERKQLMYDLAARIVDAEKLPINVIIVSGWARTGWNVIKPNLLIDATATRNVTAWQQLRGRAMRAMYTWDKECYEAMMPLLGSGMGEVVEQNENTSKDEVNENLLECKQLDKDTINLLLQVHSEATQSKNYVPKYNLRKKINQGDLSQFTDSEREQLAVEMMITRNKVTHIYELVKAYGTSIQIRQNRRTKIWSRISSIAAKHASEYSVNPFSGKYSAGEIHAPLVYFNDPREYSPEDLKKHLALVLVDCDPRIVQGWFDAVVSERRN
jgi:superfamily II DNA or RNA helicase